MLSVFVVEVVDDVFDLAVFSRSDLLPSMVNDFVNFLRFGDHLCLCDVVFLYGCGGVE